MRAEKHRNRGLFPTVALGLALGMYFSVLTASAGQPPPEKLPQPSDVAAPARVVVSPMDTGPACCAAESVRSNIPACVVCPPLPTCCDPISRVPNFFGDFVARPSLGIVNQPVTVSESSNTTVITQTLTFFGAPNDVAGGTGQSNTFYAPFGRNGIEGPGGPYRLFTNVTGFGVRIPPDISILKENAELTARINANFPGATFVGGIGLLFRPYTVIFDYLLTTAQDGTTIQTAPGLVALFSLSNPSGGGLVGRNKYFDDGSPLPRDRVFFDYNHIGDFKGLLGTPLNVNRYVLGAEKTFAGGFGSVEVRVPFAGTANSDQNGGQGLDVNNPEFGNVGLLVKGTLFRDANWIVTSGMGLSMPTADDSHILFRGKSVLEIRNKAWLLQPILGAAWAPNDRFYAQAGVQFDFDPSGNPVYAHSPSGEFTRRGVLTDQTYLYASGSVGYWLYQADSDELLSRVSLQGELHYNRTLGNPDLVQTGSVLVTDLGRNIDVLNATAGVNFVFGDQANLSVGVSFPVAGERLYDWNLMARLNFQFGAVSR